MLFIQSEEIEREKAWALEHCVSRKGAVEPSRRYERVRYMLEATMRGRKPPDEDAQLDGRSMTLMTQQHPIFEESMDPLISMDVVGRVASKSDILERLVDTRISMDVGGGFDRASAIADRSRKSPHDQIQKVGISGPLTRLYSPTLSPQACDYIRLLRYRLNIGSSL